MKDLAHKPRGPSAEKGKADNEERCRGTIIDETPPRQSLEQDGRPTRWRACDEKGRKWHRGGGGKAQSGQSEGATG